MLQNNLRKVSALIKETIIFLIGVISTGFTSPLAIHKDLESLAINLSRVTGCLPEEAIYKAYGKLEFELIDNNDFGYSCWSNLKCYGSIDPLTCDKARGLFIHELGHRFLNSLDLTYEELNMEIGYYSNGDYVHVAGINPKTGNYERTTLGYVDSCAPHIQHGLLSPAYNSYKEDFADMFMNWALGGFTDCEAGRARMKWMESFVQTTLGEPRNGSSINKKSHMNSCNTFRPVFSANEEIG